MLAEVADPKSQGTEAQANYRIAKERFDKLVRSVTEGSGASVSSESVDNVTFQSRSSEGSYHEIVKRTQPKTAYNFPPFSMPMFSPNNLGEGLIANSKIPQRSWGLSTTWRLSTAM